MKGFLTATTTTDATATSSSPSSRSLSLCWKITLTLTMTMTRVSKCCGRADVLQQNILLTVCNLEIFMWKLIISIV